MYYAGRRLLAEGERFEVGDPLPNAGNWPNIRVKVRTGHVLKIPENCTFGDLDRHTKHRVQRLKIKNKLEVSGVLGTDGHTVATSPPETLAPVELSNDE